MKKFKLQYENELDFDKRIEIFKNNRGLHVF